MVKKPFIVKSNNRIKGTEFHKMHVFPCGHQVPIFNVATTHGLNQIVGYTKLLNSKYGNVIYRGQHQLYPKIEPSICHNPNVPKTISKAVQKQTRAIKNITSDKKLQKLFGLNKHDEPSKRILIEAALQHYGHPTRCVDFVDNHWIALWFGNNIAQLGASANIVQYRRRTITPTIESLILNDDLTKRDSILEGAYQYMILIAIEMSHSQSVYGIYQSEDVYAIDLRTALPSTFLRPHAQHGWVVMRKTVGNELVYDLSPFVVCILRMRIDDVTSWLGQGALLSTENLFPPATQDHSYSVILKRNDIFANGGISIPLYL